MKTVSYLFVQFALGVLFLSESLLAQAPVASEDYKVKAEDLLSVEVFQEPDLTRDALRVEASGNISFPLLENIPVAGRTVREIEVDIERRLKDGYIKSPQVTVKVEYTEQFFVIIGEVMLDGSYPLPREKRMDLAEAIANANGFTANAKQSKIELWRDGEKKTYDFDDLLKIKDKDKKVYLKPGDRVVVPPRFF